MRILVGELLGKTYEEIYILRDITLTDEQHSQLDIWLDRRANGEPLAKILQRKDFWEHSFKTTYDTLDPRPETEFLIELVLEQKPNKKAPLKILDLGTGTGCVLISLLHEYQNATGLGVDLSPKACQVAKENLNNLGFSDRGIIVNTSWFEGVGEKFDVIVSNPPYISINENISEGAKFDPDTALYASDSGLEHYKYFAKKASNYLKSGGIVAVEYGFQQDKLVKKLFEQSGYCLLKYALDLNKINRAAIFTLLG